MFRFTFNSLTRTSIIRIYTTSRGKTLQDPLESFKGWDPKLSLDVECFVRSGASITALAEKAYEDTYYIEKGFCYFLAGLPDINERIIDKNEYYEEVIYTRESPQETAYRMDNILADISCNIKENNWTPVFSTVLPMSLSQWNYTRLSQHKTSYLLHHQQYQDMQPILNQAIEEVNRSITAINKSNRVHTPYIHNAITKVDHKKHKYYFNRLPDGVHPDEDTTAKMINILITAIQENCLRTKRKFYDSLSTLSLGECSEEKLSDFW